MRRLSSLGRLHWHLEESEDNREGRYGSRKCQNSLRDLLPLPSARQTSYNVCLVAADSGTKTKKTLACPLWHKDPRSFLNSRSWNLAPSYRDQQS